MKRARFLEVSIRDLQPFEHDGRDQVQAGPAVGDITIVEGGLAPGDRVVTGGQYKLRANAPVTITDKSQPADNDES